MPDEGEHWFPVWVVVHEGVPYVRLGSRAAARVQNNKTFPMLSVRIDGQQYDNVRGEPAPDHAVAVDNLMADKYWSDVFVRWFPHPMVVRIVPVEETPPPAAP